MDTANKKDYLKKYLSKHEPGKKRKHKKKSKTVSDRVRIIDDDADINTFNEAAQEDLLAMNEDAPQIAGIVDERPLELRMDDFRKDSAWQPVGEVNGPQNENDFAQTEKNKDSDYSPPRKGRNNDSSPPRRNKTNDSDESPPRRNRKDDDKSPPRRNKKDDDESPPRRKKNNDYDESPPRRNKRNKDESTPRRNKHNDYNESPPRRSNKNDDESPPRKNIRNNHSPASKWDNSPPRTNKQGGVESPNRKSKNFDSPPRNSKRDEHIRKYKRDGDFSPPRKGKNRDSPPRKNKRDNGLSPPRRYKQDDMSNSSRNMKKDYSPPRKNMKDDHNPRRNQNFDNSPPRKTNKNNAAVTRKRSPSPLPYLQKENSPPVYHSKRKRSRWGTESQSDSPINAEKMSKTLDGKTAGLQNAKDLITETLAFKQREEEIYKNMSADVSGANASTIVRDRKTGKIRDFEQEAIANKEKSKKQNEVKEKYEKWGKGTKQVEDYNKKLEQDVYETTKPLARYADDADLEEHLKAQDRAGDPMLAYIKKKRRKDEGDTGKPVKLQFEGEFMPNRFGIRPGHNWDGVDRSNGYETKWFEVINQKLAQKDEAYRWNSEDM